MIPATLKNGQQKLAESLVGKWVRFRHRQPKDDPPFFVDKAFPNGMVHLEGVFGGEFAPHLFVIVDPPAKRKESQ